MAWSFPNASSLLVALLLTTLTVAGCLGNDAPDRPPAAEPEAAAFGLGKTVEVHVPLGDGMTAHGMVFLPNGTGPFPLVLDLGPYFGASFPITWVDESHPPDVVTHHLLQDGYAIARVSLRGTGASTGCFTIGGPVERQDAATIVEWLAAQDWSTGNVAMMGISYDGTTPWEAAVTGTPSLKAIVPIAGILDLYSFTFYDGVPILRGAYFNTQYLQYADWGMEVPLWPLRPDHHEQCQEQVEVLVTPYETHLDGVHGPYWDARDQSALLSEVTVPVLLVHGLKDPIVLPHNIQGHWGATSGEAWWILGQWGHGLPWGSVAPEARHPGFNETLRLFLDAHLRGDQTAHDALQALPPVQVADSRFDWHGLDAWPPQDATEAAWHLTGESLSADEGTGPGRSFLSRPCDTCFMGGERTTLTYTSDPLASPAHFMGNPSLELVVETTLPGAGELAVVLYDEDPEGLRTPITQGYLDLAQREGVDQNVPMEPGEPTAVAIRLLATAHVLEEGHTLRLVMWSSDPSYDVPVQKDPQRFTVHGGRLLLPALSATL